MNVVIFQDISRLDLSWNEAFTKVERCQVIETCGINGETLLW